LRREGENLFAFVNVSTCWSGARRKRKKNTNELRKSSSVSVYDGLAKEKEELVWIAEEDAAGNEKTRSEESWYWGKKEKSSGPQHKRCWTRKGLQSRTAGNASLNNI